MLFLGVDIGGTKIAAGIVDSNGKVIKHAQSSTPASKGGDAVLTAAVKLAKVVLAGSKAEIHSIGVGAGGQIDSRSGVVVSSTDLLPGWAGQKVADRFKNVFNVPCFVENDVNALALGEHRFGAAQSQQTVVFLALGTGVGGALLMDGKVRHGAHWSAGEIGHIIINSSNDARIDSGGHRGTLEAYASGHGLVENWREITGDRSAITGIEIAEAAKHDIGGPAQLAVAQTGTYLGYGLVSVISMLDPDLIVIGGGLSALGDQILNPARSIIREQALRTLSACPVVVTSLGAKSSVIGASSVAMEAQQ